MASLLLSSCGGDKPKNPENPSSPAPPSAPPDSGIVRIRGGERLGWIQFATSSDAIRAHSFRLYIDGNSSALADTSCASTPAQDGYECSGRLPTMPAGQHRLELSSVWNGVESGRSSALMIMMGTGLTEPDAETAVASVPSAESLDATAVAGGLDDVEWLSSSPDGGLLFLVEGRRAVRVIEGERLVDAPAYTIESQGDAIVGMAVDPAFAKTRAVYLAWSELQRDGSRALSVSRLRFVGNALGERATIVSGLPFPADASAPLAIDADGLIYLAMPSADGMGRSGSDAAFNGYILRFARDGRVPDANRMASPILAVGFARPTSMAIDHQNRRLWAAGQRSSTDHALVTIAFDDVLRGAWPARAEPAPAQGAARPGFAISSLSFTPPGVPSHVNVVSSGVARKAPLDATGAVGAFETIRFGAPGAVTGIADRHDGRAYASVKAVDGTSAIFLTQN